MSANTKQKLEIRGKCWICTGKTNQKYLKFELYEQFFYGFYNLQQITEKSETGKIYQVTFKTAKTVQSKKEVGVWWENIAKNKKTYLTIIFGDKYYVAFTNKWKKTDKSPDFIVYEQSFQKEPKAQINYEIPAQCFV